MCIILLFFYVAVFAGVIKNLMQLFRLPMILYLTKNDISDNLIEINIFTTSYINKYQQEYQQSRNK
jgi:hypothetical protein